MNTPPQRPPTGEPDDEAFEAFLAAADAQLMEHVRSHSDPTRALTALMQIGEELGPSAMPTPPPLTYAKHVEGGTRRVKFRLAAKNLLAALDAVRGFAQDLGLVRELDDLHRLLYAADVPVLGRAVDHVNRLVHDFARVLDRELDRGLRELRAHVRDPDLVRILELDLVLELDHVRDLSQDLILFLDQARDRDLAILLIRDLSCARHLALALDSVLARTYDRAKEMDTLLMGMLVDISGGDLSDALADWATAPLQVLEALSGVMWDDTTRWPPDLKEIIESLSELITPGRYRVRDGSERDPHEAAPV